MQLPVDGLAPDAVRRLLAAAEASSLLRRHTPGLAH